MPCDLVVIQVSTGRYVHVIHHTVVPVCASGIVPLQHNPR